MLLFIYRAVVGVRLIFVLSPYFYYFIWPFFFLVFSFMFAMLCIIINHPHRITAFPFFFSIQVVADWCFIYIQQYSMAHESINVLLFIPIILLALKFMCLSATNTCIKFMHLFMWLHQYIPCTWIHNDNISQSQK